MKENFKVLFLYYIQYFKLVLLWGVGQAFLSVFLQKFFNFDIWKTHTGIDDGIKKVGILITFWLVVIKMPIIEELAFRLFLDFRKWNIIIGSFFFFYVSTNLFFYDATFVYPILFSLFSSFLVWVGIEMKANIFEKSKLPVIFRWISILLFGLYHITNFSPINPKFALIYIYYLIPQIIFGYYETKIRIEMGIIWAIIFHIFNNSLPFTIGIIKISLIN